MAASLSLIAGPQLFADVVYVTARPQPSGAGANPDGSYHEINITLGDTSAKSGVADAPTRPGARAYVSTPALTSTTSGIDLTPSLAVPGAAYLIEYTFSSTAGNANTNAVFSATAIGATLAFSTTDKFQAQYGTSPQVWKPVGYFTNNPGSTTPTISLRYQSGFINSTKRLVIDAFRFTLAQPCLGVAAPSPIGPAGAGQTNVTVSGVAAGATAVSVYQDSGSGMVVIGSKTTGITAGNNTVTVSPLVKLAKVSATQTVGGQESCVQSSGLLVGGGANPRIRMVLSMREAPGAAGPVGANGLAYTTNNGRIHFLGASALLSGAAPADGLVVYPSNTWQTVTFERGPDPANPTNTSVIWNSNIAGQNGTLNDLQGDWGTIEAIAFVIDDLNDTGPQEIYIDNIANGGITNSPQVVDDFEAGTNGQSGFTFEQPSFSGTTSGNILTAPNVSVIATNTADTGANCLRTSWQWSDTNSTRWLRLTTSAVTSGHPNPLVNLNDPITLRLLVLPVGAAPPPPPPAFVPPGNITILNNGSGNIILNWTGSHTLQSSTDVTGPYTDFAGPILTGPYTNAATGTTMFFRLKN